VPHSAQSISAIRAWISRQPSVPLAQRFR
jgi:hypothetical protein